jgi:hypothetical protein
MQELLPAESTASAPPVLSVSPPSVSPVRAQRHHAGRFRYAVTGEGPFIPGHRSMMLALLGGWLLRQCGRVAVVGKIAKLLWGTAHGRALRDRGFVGYMLRMVRGMVVSRLWHRCRMRWSRIYRLLRLRRSVVRRHRRARPLPHHIESAACVIVGLRLRHGLRSNAGSHGLLISTIRHLRLVCRWNWHGIGPGVRNNGLLHRGHARSRDK